MFTKFESRREDPIHQGTFFSVRLCLWSPHTDSLGKYLQQDWTKTETFWVKNQNKLERKALQSCRGSESQRPPFIHTVTWSDLKGGGFSNRFSCREHVVVSLSCQDPQQLLLLNYSEIVDLITSIEKRQRAAGLWKMKGISAMRSGTTVPGTHYWPCFIFQCFHSYSYILLSCTCAADSVGWSYQ